MSMITIDDVRRLARLCSIELSAVELEAMTADMTNILDYIEQLQSIDTSGVVPTYQVTGLKNIMRRDIPQQTADQTGLREKLLSLADESKDNQIKVPKVL